MGKHPPYMLQNLTLLYFIAETYSFFHVNVDSDYHVTFTNDKCSAMVDISQRGLERNTTVYRKP
jgi:hypothetical protein